MALSIGGDVAKRVVKLAKAVEQGSFDTVKKAAEIAKAEQLKRMRADSGGDLKLSGVGRAKGKPGNAAIGVNIKVSKASGFGVDATAVVRATGPLQLINNDTAGRVIRSAYQSGQYRKSSKGRGGVVASQFIGPALPGATFTGDRRAVLNIPGIGFRRSARHPGTKGKGTWQVGRKAAEPKIRQAMSKRTTTTLAKAMKG